MSGLLKEAKFTYVDNYEEADILVINTCTVKTPSEKNFYDKLAEIKEKYPYKTIVVAGCIPQTDPGNPALKKMALTGTRQIHHIVEVVEEALHNNNIQLLETDEVPPLELPRKRWNQTVGIIPINLGCLGACSFCKTKQARLNLKSYPIPLIVSEVKKMLKEGVKEIWLTSQDTFCYGFDIGTDLGELLKEVVMVDGEFKVRVGMGNPDHLLKFKEKMILAYQSPKVFKFLHLPLQSGSDEVLKLMRRNYSVKEFLGLICVFKEKVPHLNLMTDVIVGFPGETEEQYIATLDLIRKISPDSVNISRFWPRRGTAAYDLERVPGEEVKRRSRILTEVFQNISRIQNEKWIGWEGEILIDEKGETGQWIGRNSSYKPVIVTGNYRWGDKLKVKAVRAEVFAIMGVSADKGIRELV
jgi:MiaB-like tRNA modifying enzyme